MDKRKRLAAAAATVILLGGEYLKKKERRRRRWWMVSLYKSRKTYNATDLLYDLTREPSGYFENFCRMSAADFEYLLNLIGPFIAKQDTNMRKCIPIQERLAVTLRFLATGDKFSSLAYLFKFSKSTIATCIMEVCQALIQELREEVKKETQTQEMVENENTLPYQKIVANLSEEMAGSLQILENVTVETAGSLQILENVTVETDGSLQILENVTVETAGSMQTLENVTVETAGSLQIVENETVEMAERLVAIENETVEMADSLLAVENETVEMAESLFCVENGTVAMADKMTFDNQLKIACFDNN
ncbi:hypothetical protein EVAR_87206_1 [Eumeta japonica]|uniref:Nuclease HARBI1 n=1 Tax=Eumeta variegata TaxID=151549 RepID=A0A4C1VXW2_EUMVA|nr:hypothetical protein EVAR_87206_1 [Eumeta japonica]